MVNQTVQNFQKFLLEQAGQSRKNIVLPEAEEPRILKAAAEILKLDLVDLTLLGEAEIIQQQAEQLGLDLSAAKIISLNDQALLEQFAQTYYELRKAKGVTLEQAQTIVQEPSYFGTMLVHLGHVDGMVSGAIHTTLNTIKPSFEIIKTQPGVSVVSSYCVMCLDEGLYLYADCGVNPNPTPDQLAEIAVTTANSAKALGLTPRVAMLSYSSGSSGKGVSIDAVKQATLRAHELAPEVLLDGPIQYDAAVDQAVAELKMPESPVAGRANTFIFPDLNAGNITYKAVQRSTGTVAIGPVLQGLNKPVNDLSRGALVEDIVFAILITAVQAQ